MKLPRPNTNHGVLLDYPEEQPMSNGNEKPSIAIWIDPATQVVKIDFSPQRLQPAEYGIVLSSLIFHLAEQFAQDNPSVKVEVLIAEILRGLEAGISQRQDFVLPQHHTH